MGSAAESTSFKGRYTGEDGFLGFNEICEYLKDPNHRWTIIFGKYLQAPYMFREKEWVGYDDERSIRKKSEFAFDQGLAGVMIWSIDTDDFTGNCFGTKFPLLRAINNALYLRANGINGVKERSGADNLSVSVFSLVSAVAVLAYNFHHL